MSAHETELLGAYVLGVLEGGEQESVRSHLDDCPKCRKEVDELREMEAALGELPPEALLDGPPEGGDLLLQRTLKQVRGERARGENQRRAVWLAAAAVVAVAVLGGGALLGRQTAPDQPVVQAGPTAPTAALPSGTRTATATNASTGATMTATVIPAAGWVRVHAEVSGVAAGQQCRLYVIAADGARREAGSWVVSDKAAAEGGSVDGSALVAPGDVASVQVETFGGAPLVNVPV